MTGWRQRWRFARYSAVVARRNRNIGDVNHAIASLCVLFLVIYRSVLIVSGSFILGGHVAGIVFLVGALYDLHLILIPDFFLCGLQLLECQLPHIPVLDKFREQTGFADFRLYSKISSGDTRRTSSPGPVRRRRRYSWTRALRFDFPRGLAGFAG